MPQDFIKQLREQTEFMRSSASAYDSGMEAEAKRLALALRLLLHSSGRQVPLLEHLGVRDDLPYVDTAIEPMPELEADFALGLCRLRYDGVGSDGRMGYVPPLGDLGEYRVQPPASFVDWWTDPILVDRRGAGVSFSRRTIVLGVANQDGGAHVDSDLDAAYYDLTRANSMRINQFHGGMGFMFGGDGRTLNVGEPPDNSLALASVRQIAYELLETLDTAVLEKDGTLTVRRVICRGSRHETLRAGRNEPCRCGSGRKTKRCAGLRQPRNPRMITSGAAAMV